jgi:aspartate racemase
MAPDIEKRTGLKVLHIADVTGEEIKRKSIGKVALLGTKFTMEGTFYKKVLKDKHDIDVVIPNDEDREVIHNIIYNELVRGIIKDDSRQKYIKIIDKLVDKGAEGVVLGCTEIPLLIKQKDVSISIFNTTEIHSKAAVRYAIDGEI